MYGIVAFIITLEMVEVTSETIFPAAGHLTGAKTQSNQDTVVPYLITSVGTELIPVSWQSAHR